MYETSDGWLAPIRHYPGAGDPVLLVHGMGANHYNWDYRREISLAHHLQSLGWDVWVPELRGDPGSVPPARRAVREVRFVDHAERDLPVIVDRVLEATDRDALVWVGHSMGGMLLYTALADYPEKVRAGVAICSPSQFVNPTGPARLFRAVGGLLGHRGPRLPTRSMAALAAPLGRANPLVPFLARPKNLDTHHVAGLARSALLDMYRPMGREVRGWLKTGHLARPDGTPWLVADPTPLLVMGATRDRVASEADVAATCAFFPSCTYQRISAADGFSSDYGHIDPVLGARAREEIFPLISDFLDAYRSP